MKTNLLETVWTFLLNVRWKELEDKHEVVPVLELAVSNSLGVWKKQAEMSL